MDRSMEKTALRAAVAEVFPDMKRIGETLFAHPETGLAEYESSRLLAEEFRKIGFSVTCPCGGMPTALRADLVCGEGPTIAFLGEYDALPGFGPDGRENAHACGHNWIAAVSYGACAALARLKGCFSGTVSFIGCPAEETVGGKAELLRAGIFSDVSAALQIHLGPYTRFDTKLLAIDSVEFTFHGRAAHAAAQPELGINALDAVVLTYNGISCLRQHITPDARIHGIMTEGGKAVNIVPDLGQCRFYIRALSREYLNTLTQRVCDIARGAALMTGASLEIRYFENSLDDLICHPKLLAALQENLAETGAEADAPEGTDRYGSSDIGNVSHALPTAFAELACGLPADVPVHSEGFLAAVKGPLADKTMPAAAWAMGMTALDVFRDPCAYLS